MNTTCALPHVPRPQLTRRVRVAVGATLLAAFLTMLLAGCGGGVGSGGTGSFGSGPVSGFGSIFVGGIEFDDSQAAVLDDDGVAVAAASETLGLGKVAEVQGADVVPGASGPTAAAATIQLARLVVGPVAASDVAGRTLTVLGQELQINGSTVFDPAIHGGLAGLRPGDVVSVYAFADALGHPIATRIEPASTGEPWRLRGYVASVNAPARQIAIGSALLDYSTATDVPADLAADRFVQVKVASAAAGGVLQVAGFLPATRAPSSAADVVSEGVAAALVPGSSFRLGALEVDSHGAAIAPAGAVLAPGAQVQVQGRLQGGTLVAATVTVISAAASGRRSYQLVGTPSGLNTASQTFVVRGVGVDYSGARFVNGTAASLSAPNASVHVQGTLSADGVQIDASTVIFR